MMRYKLVAAMLLPTLLLTGCGGSGETRRSTSNSANLTGLWRMQLTTAQNGMTAESNVSFHVTEAAGVLNMVACDNRDQVKLQKTAAGIDGLPVGTMKIVNNDTMTAANDLGTSKATKMATTAKFNPGQLFRHHAVQRQAPAVRHPGDRQPGQRHLQAVQHSGRGRSHAASAGRWSENPAQPH